MKTDNFKTGLLRVRDAAEIAGLKKRSIYHLIDIGALKGVWINHKSGCYKSRKGLRVVADSLESYRSSKKIIYYDTQLLLAIIIPNKYLSKKSLRIQDEVCKILSCSDGHVRNQIRKRRLQTQGRGRISAASFVKFLKQCIEESY